MEVCSITDSLHLDSKHVTADVYRFCDASTNSRFHNNICYFHLKSEVGSLPSDANAKPNPHRLSPLPLGCETDKENDL